MYIRLFVKRFLGRELRMRGGCKGAEILQMKKVLQMRGFRRKFRFKRTAIQRTAAKIISRETGCEGGEIKQRRTRFSLKCGPLDEQGSVRCSQSRVKEKNASSNKSEKTTIGKSESLVFEPIIPL